VTAIAQPTALPVVTAFEWVPPFARGLVRDLRVRWALEEIGRAYATELFGPSNPMPDDYTDRQPFAQVPAFEDNGLRIFETGAILLYLAERDERLLPAAGQDRWTAIAWTFAALNSVDPAIGRLASYDLFHADADWMPEARASAETMVQRKLQRLTQALDGRDWLAGVFSIADIQMVATLDSLRHTDLLAQFPVVAAYAARGRNRPAYQAALAAQLADFSEDPA
jgi:glutathione S-transferase